MPHQRVERRRNTGIDCPGVSVRGMMMSATASSNEYCAGLEARLWAEISKQLERCDNSSAADEKNRAT